MLKSSFASCLMIDRTTRFAVETSKLKSPTSTSFSITAWEDAFAKGSTTTADQRLLEAARWIATEATAAPGAFPNPTFASLSPEWGSILAVAMLNREYRTAYDLAQRNTKASVDAGILSLTTIAALRVRGAADQEVSVEALTEAATDCTENWLFDAARSNGTSGADIDDLASTAVQATKFYSFRKGLNVLWNQALYEGWYVEQDEAGIYHWRPDDAEYERFRFACLSRQMANLMNYANIDRTVWTQLGTHERRMLARKFSVVAVKEHNGRLQFRVGAIPYLSKHMPPYMYEKAMLEVCYVADFIDSPMPVNPCISVSLILQAWHVLLDIAMLLCARIPLPTTLRASEARKLALATDRRVLVDALAKALQVTPDTTDAIVTFLTFASHTGGAMKAKGNKGLWAAPLIAVPGTTELLLALPVLATSNPARRAEAWLEKGGINDDNPVCARGDRYEALYRIKICRAIANNEKFTTALCAKDGVTMTHDFAEQIDLLVAFGDLCLVGEVKFFLMPAEPHERERYDKKLKVAAAQAKRKAKELGKRPDVIASHLEVDMEVASALALKLLPIIVTNQGYGFSTRIDNVLLVEAAFLCTYLGSSELVSGMALAPGSGRSATQSTSFYETEAAAANNFEAQMSAPYVLTRFFDRIVWSTTTWPTIAHGKTLIDMPVLGDLTRSERIQAELLAADLLR